MRWQYSSLDDMNGRRETAAGLSYTTCLVNEVKSFRWGVVSSIGCEDVVDEDGRAHPIAGVWAATADGLYRSTAAGVLAGDASDLAGRQPLLDAMPQVRQRAYDERFGASLTFGDRVTRQGNAWCSESTFDDGRQSLCCLTREAGFVYGGWSSDGDRTRQHTFKVVASPLED